MLSDYIRAAMHSSHYSVLDDGTFLGEIPQCDGLWGNVGTLEACRDDLESALEDWILLGVYIHHELPVIDGIDLNLSVPAGEEVA
jgi:hypothetical protein